MVTALKVNPKTSRLPTQASNSPIREQTTASLSIELQAPQRRLFPFSLLWPPRAASLRARQALKPGKRLGSPGQGLQASASACACHGLQVFHMRTPYVAAIQITSDLALQCSSTLLYLNSSAS